MISADRPGQVGGPRPCRVLNNEVLQAPSRGTPQSGNVTLLRQEEQRAGRAGKHQQECPHPPNPAPAAPEAGREPLPAGEQLAAADECEGQGSSRGRRQQAAP